MDNFTLTALEGYRIGHAHNLNGPTGCTVILPPPETIGGIDQRGGAPGTRETDLLRPMHLVEQVHAILLTGGSAYGLDAATGVMRFLEEQGIGYPVGVGVVPIVPAAVIFDLDVGDPRLRPDAAMGYAACEQASVNPVIEGCVGAGAGARVGRLLGPLSACKSGIGSALVRLTGDIQVAALMVVNAAGDVVDEQGRIMAGARTLPDGDRFADTMGLLLHMAAPTSSSHQSALPSNTVVGVVATNAYLSKEETNKVAQMAHDGLAQAVRPAHSMRDGDTIFALASSMGRPADVSVIGAFAAQVTAQAIRRAVLSATPLAGLPTGKSITD